MMGLSGGAVGAGGVGADGTTGGSSCCDMSMKWWCRWRWEYQQHFLHHRVFSSGLAFFLCCLVLYGSIGILFGWLMFNKPHMGVSGLVGFNSIGCQEDNEGSWSIGIFYGDSPFSLKPIETMTVEKDEKAAWPVANPVVTCASVSDAGFPSNFVADPFLYVQVADLERKQVAACIFLQGGFL